MASWFFWTVTLIGILSIAGDGYARKNRACKDLCGKFLNKKAHDKGKGEDKTIKVGTNEIKEETYLPKGKWSTLGHPASASAKTRKPKAQKSPKTRKNSQARGRKKSLWNSIPGHPVTESTLLRKKREAKPFEPPTGVRWDFYDLSKTVAPHNRKYLEYFGNGWNPRIREAHQADQEEYRKTHDCSPKVGIKYCTPIEKVKDYTYDDNLSSDEPVPPYEWAPFDSSKSSCTSLLCPTDSARRKRGSHPSSGGAGMGDLLKRAFKSG